MPAEVMPYVVCDGEGRPRSIDIFVIDVTEREMAVATTESIPTRAGQLPRQLPHDGIGKSIRSLRPRWSSPGDSSATQATPRPRAHRPERYGARFVRRPGA